jgi:hypothetical protein
MYTSANDWFARRVAFFCILAAFYLDHLASASLTAMSKRPKWRSNAYMEWLIIVCLVLKNYRFGQEQKNKLIGSILRIHIYHQYILGYKV